MTNEKLPKFLAVSPFSLEEAIAAGLTKYAVSKLLKQGSLERVSHGIYQAADRAMFEQEDQYRSATLRCGQPSAICLLSALEHYHLTDLIPNKTWIMVPNEKRVRANELKLVRLRKPHWEIGIRKASGYWITSIDRTLIECLLQKRLISSTEALSAIKQALEDKKTTLHNLFEVARKMKVLDRVLPYIQAFTI